MFFFFGGGEGGKGGVGGSVYSTRVSKMIEVV